MNFEVPNNIEGTYYLALRAADAAGNDTGVPTGNGTASFMFDVTRPGLPGETVSPNCANNSALPFHISYSGASDAGSGSGWTMFGYGIARS